MIDVFSEATCLEKAVWLEHQVFLANKSEPMYKMKYMSKVRRKRKEGLNIFSSLVLSV